MLRPMRLFLALATLGLAQAASAAPEGADDPLAQLLVERGVITAPQAPTIRSRASELVVAALAFLDLPYRGGGNSAAEGFDCSGFTRHIFGLTLGVALPRRVDDQAGARGLIPVARDELKPGDLVFFNTLRRSFSHVGIYVGDGRFVHAPRTGAVVRVENMRTAYWHRRFTGARRASAAGDAATD